MALAGSFSCLVVACGWTLHREKQRLDDLIATGGEPPKVDVYGRWLALDPSLPVSRVRVEATLKRLDYRGVPAEPAAPGGVHLAGDEIAVYTRAFRFPDGAWPATIVHLEFSSNILTRVLDARGSPVSNWRLEPIRLAEWSPDAGAIRTRVHLSDLPPYVPEAVVAVEDKRFYGHGALDPIGLTRALWVDVRRGGLRQGASTIAQQLARSVFLSPDRTWRRKLVEAGLAVYLEMHFSKTQLLEMYLNQVYWGQDGSRSLLGIESVSRALFGKSATKLSLSESALLAGLLQSPNRLSPRTAWSVAMERRNHVLGLMREQRRITEAQLQAALRETIVLSPPSSSANAASYFLAMLHDDLADRYSLPALLQSGWSIFTTLDPLLQDAATSAVRSVRNEFPAPAKPKISNRHDAMADEPQAALVALDPANGAIRAWVGGTDFARSPFDRAGRARRQPGSAFKPFVALAALERRKATTATLLSDTPLTVTNNGTPWTPKNFDHVYHGAVSLWDSLAQSLNVPMVRLAMQVGLPSVIDAAHRAGIESPLRPVPALALGAGEVTVLELTRSYATLADGGRRNDPYYIETIMNPDGSIVDAHQCHPVNAFAAEPVFLVNQMLQAVIDEGTGRPAKAAGLSPWVAGKTGTSENNQDAWFVGFNPDMACGVWVGYDRPKSLRRAAAGVALPVWAAFMKSEQRLDVPSPPAPQPTGLVWKKIDPASGALVRSGCPKRADRAFIAGTEPRDRCPLHAGGIVGFFKRITGKTPKPATTFGH